MTVRYAEDRHPGGDEAAGIASLHAFSFGPFYDPGNLRFGALIACNEEWLAPGAGFDEHRHSHTEIVTWVVDGELTHRDSAGRATVVRPGDVQRLSAGAGVRHSERNEGAEPLVFVQMWLAPLEPGGDPAYDLVRGIADSTPYALPAAGAMLHVRRLAPGERSAVPDAAFLYVHVVRGAVLLGGEELRPGDSARVTGSRGLELTGHEPGEPAPGGVDGACEVLVWEMAAPV
ncbi:pirin family protein [Streptomyces fuscigenes]|uniref:pirin family protein n=1 Tax=Streptomyces fuscigenes TaxID=1528880 RepID=UPI001F463192|nr:pirin family protein [Streptomyces fuscigenes]MCF3963793.1 pirin family protein [Streptomyces fuscigenes]